MPSFERSNYSGVCQTEMLFWPARPRGRPNPRAQLLLYILTRHIRSLMRRKWAQRWPWALGRRTFFCSGMQLDFTLVQLFILSRRLTVRCLTDFFSYDLSPRPTHTFISPLLSLTLSGAFPQWILNWKSFSVPVNLFALLFFLHTQWAPPHFYGSHGGCLCGSVCR